jgi:spore coat polysaccharide biosynthesis protein SpsF (cytidylyltransferase family)
MGSTRLPGKALVDIGGQTALERVIRQLRKCREPLGQIIVATTWNREDEAILREAERLGVIWFRGLPDDVLERFARCHQEASKMFGGDFIVRITADCPFLDPGLLDRTIELVSRRGYDYAGVKGAPDGTHQEAFTAEILHAAHRWARDPEDREHVVPWVIRNGDCGWIHAPNDGPPLTLDTPEDLESLREYASAAR